MFVWRRLVWFVERPGAWISTLMALVGFVYGACFIRPNVAAPPADRENPFKLPFSVSNDSWIPMLDVMPLCRLECFSTETLKMGSAEWSGFERWGELSAGERKYFSCVMATYEKYTQLVIGIDVHYRLGLTRLLSWGRTRPYVFSALRDSEGVPQWVEGHDLAGGTGCPDEPPLPPYAKAQLDATRLRPGVSDPSTTIWVIGRTKKQIQADQQGSVRP